VIYPNGSRKQEYLADLITKVVNSQPNSQIGELLLWA